MTYRKQGADVVYFDRFGDLKPFADLKLYWGADELNIIQPVSKIWVDANTADTYACNF